MDFYYETPYQQGAGTVLMKTAVFPSMMLREKFIPLTIFLDCALQQVSLRELERAADLDVLGALDGFGVFPQLLNEEVTGFVDPLLDGNGIGS